MISTWKRWWAEETSSFVRLVTGCIGLGLFLIGWDPLLNSDQASFTNPIFDTVQRLASLEAWGALHWIAAALMLFSATSGKFLLYTFALPLAIVVQLTWFLCIMWAKVVDGAPFSTTGVGLSVLALLATASTAMYPIQLAGSKPVAVVIDRQLVPFEQAS